MHKFIDKIRNWFSKSDPQEDPQEESKTIALATKRVANISYIDAESYIAQMIESGAVDRLTDDGRDQYDMIVDMSYQYIEASLRPIICVHEDEPSKFFVTSLEAIEGKFIQ